MGPAGRARWPRSATCGLCPWVAIDAAIVSTSAAVWQIANYALTGGRTKVQLRIGAMNGQKHDHQPAQCA